MYLSQMHKVSPSNVLRSGNSTINKISHVLSVSEMSWMSSVENRDSGAKYKIYRYSQVVRQGSLKPRCEGPNPSTCANKPKGLCIYIYLSLNSYSKLMYLSVK